MTPQNLMDYVKIYENQIDKNTCSEAVKNLEKSKWVKHSYHEPKFDLSITYDYDLSVTNEEIPEKNYINQQVWNCLEKYILKDFMSFSEWFDGWNGYSFVRFNKYDPNTLMRLHCDHIQTLFDGTRKGIPILTILGALNDEYEGGEFVMFQDKVIPFPTGSIIVFPSNFMFPHQVLPVKSGVRYSFVSWSW